MTINHRPELFSAEQRAHPLPGPTVKASPLKEDNEMARVCYIKSANSPGSFESERIPEPPTEAWHPTELQTLAAEFGDEMIHSIAIGSGQSHTESSRITNETRRICEAAIAHIQLRLACDVVDEAPVEAETRSRTKSSNRDAPSDPIWKAVQDSIDLAYGAADARLSLRQTNAIARNLGAPDIVDVGLSRGQADAIARNLGVLRR